MSKARISTLLLMMLLTVTASTAMASANEILEIRFNAYVDGECLTVYGTDIMEPTNYTEILWGGYGKGEAGIIGSAKKPFETVSEGPFEDIYKSEEVNALGFISLSWTEKGRDAYSHGKHSLYAVIYSTESTIGFFKPDTLSAVPMPGGDIKVQDCLSFEAIHMYPKGSEIISGVACWFTVSGFTGDPDVDTNWVMLVDLDKSMVGGDGSFEYAFLYVTIWANQETVIPGEGPPVPATKVFEWNMEVISQA